MLWGGIISCKTLYSKRLVPYNLLRKQKNVKPCHLKNISRKFQIQNLLKCNQRNYHGSAEKSSCMNSLSAYILEVPTALANFTKLANTITYQPLKLEILITCFS